MKRPNDQPPRRNDKPPRKTVPGSSKANAEETSSSDSDRNQPQDPLAARQHRFPGGQQLIIQREAQRRERARQNAARLRQRRKERIAELIQTLKELTDRQLQLDADIAQLQRELEEATQENVEAQGQLLLLGVASQPDGAASVRHYQQENEMALPASSSAVQPTPAEIALHPPCELATLGSPATPSPTMSYSEGILSMEMLELVQEYIEIETALQTARSLPTSGGEESSTWRPSLMEKRLPPATGELITLPSRALAVVEGPPALPLPFTSTPVSLAASPEGCLRPPPMKAAEEDRSESASLNPSTRHINSDLQSLIILFLLLSSQHLGANLSNPAA